MADTEDVKGGIWETILRLMTIEDKAAEGAGLKNEQIAEKALGMKNQLLEYLSRYGALTKSIVANNPLSGNAPAPSAGELQHIEAMRQDFLMKELARQALLNQQQMGIQNQFNPGVLPGYRP